MARPLVDQLNLACRNLEATLAFYRVLGVEIPEDAVWRTPTGPHHANARTTDGLDLEFDSYALARVYNAGFREPQPGGAAATLISLRFSSREAVDECHGRVTGAGYRSLQAPYDTFWGARYAIVEDPDGRPVGLMSEPDPARRSPPPEI